MADEAAIPGRSRELEAGALVQERYRILRPLGAGGLGTTYLARDELWGRSVALKLVHAGGPTELELIGAEFDALRASFHPSLAQVHDLGLLTAQGAARGFYTADYVEGTTLGAFSRGRRWNELSRPFGDALRALAHLHGLGIRHGDFKPDNVLVATGGGPKSDSRGVLIDLSCARPLEQSKRGAGIRAEHAVAGTPGFIAPELLDGAEGDERADLYAVGVTLQELGATLASPAPRAVATLATRLMQARADHRPSSVDEVLEALGEEPCRVHPVQARIGQLVGRDGALRRAEAALVSLHADAERLSGARGSATIVGSARLLHLVGPDDAGRSRLLREIKWRAQHHLAVVEASPRAVGSVEALLAELTLGADRGSPLVAMVDDAHHCAGDLLDALRRCARSLGREAPTLLVVASDASLELEGSALERIALGPLEHHELDEWLAGALSRRTIDAIARVSRGMPGVVRRLLEAVATGQLAEEDLEGSAHGLPAELLARAWAAAADTTGTPSIDALEPAERRALVLLCACRDRLGVQDLDELGAGGALLGGLVGRGLVTRDERGLAPHPRYGDELVGLPSHELRHAHEALAQWLGRRSGAAEPALRAEVAARCAFHWAEAGRADEAARIAREHVGAVPLSPNAWYRAALAFERATQGARGCDERLLVTRMLREAGHPAEAAERVGRVAQARLSVAARGLLLVERGNCALATGDLHAARGAFEGVLAPTRARPRLPALIVAAAQVGRAQTELRAGGYRAAANAAAAAIELLDRQACDRAAGADQGLLDPVALLVDALGSAALAASSLGQRDRAHTLLERALGTLADRADPRRVVRLLGARALLAYEAGQIAEATADHRRVLELVEQHALRDRIANAALNLGTACHQQARWAEALRSYLRGLRAALVGDQRSTAALLRFNLGKLYADLGQLERATHHVEQCRAAAAELRDGMLGAASDSLRAEIALASGDPSRARELARRARDGLGEHGSRREQAEIELQRADIELVALDLAPGAGALSRHDSAELLRAAEAHVERAVELARGVEARDVAQRIALTRSRLAARRGAGPEAIEQAEAVVEQCAAHGLVDLAAEADEWVARFWHERGATVLAQKHEALARERWERSLADLPATFHGAFWDHPRRRPIPDAKVAAPQGAARSEPEREQARASRREQQLERLLAVNQRLNSTLETRVVLELAMDAAIELAGAERGFLLLAGAEMEPAVARHFEGTPLDAGHQAFSRAIAAEVMASGEPLVTADARADARFAHGSSVHLMNLKSVACVPVVSPRGVLGVLYLDNRFERGRFGPEDVGLLVAFATQVAIALDNARLHEELALRNAELEVERARVEALARGQAEEIDRLNEQVRRTQIVREHRFDYSAIVGRSRALDEVLGVLDRVIDTDLPVLVQGESGTGKELVVRAIHHNSPRRARRLVAINCAALPENLLESELFGYERGAFTGADRARDGLVVQAEGGTLFLDEIGEMPKPMQSKLLRVLQEREVQPLGGARTVPVDFRLVCATNRRLREEAATGGFREDLYYRLSAVELVLPPLRERAEDIPELVSFLLGRVAEQLRRPRPEVSPAALRKLVGFDWPGNVRQLEHVLTKAAALAEAGRIEAADVELPRPPPLTTLRDGRRGHREQEVARIAAALAENRWNVTLVARLLGIPRPTLYRRIQRYGLAPHVLPPPGR